MRFTDGGLRKVMARDRDLFLHQSRKTLRLECLYKPGIPYIGVKKLIYNEIKKAISECDTMDHQILLLRKKITLESGEFQQRYLFTQLMLDCLQRHHNQIYEGVLFGSTINGLGFKDSDVDLRLRLLKPIGDYTYEPQVLNDDMVERTLRDVAYQTNICSPCSGEFVPSTRCPVAKLSFHLHPSDNPDPNLFEALKYDVSLSSNNSLGSFNTLFLRFLCYLEPKFHLLATVIRYWSKAHELIVPGYLSSYAMVNMLIFFCQVTEPPLLPTVDHMRDMYFTYPHDEDEILTKTGLTQLEWHCIVCLKKDLYTPSRNTEPLSVLLLRFFEFYLKFPYQTHIITTRPGRALTHDEFKDSSHFHPGFPIRTYLNIQDPFDLRHNLTSGMNGDFFKKFIMVISHSYEVLFFELTNRFRRPKNNQSKEMKLNPHTCGNDDSNDWGINALFVKMSNTQIAREPIGKKNKAAKPKPAIIKNQPPPDKKI